MSVPPQGASKTDLLSKRLGRLSQYVRGPWCYTFGSDLRDVRPRAIGGVASGVLSNQPNYARPRFRVVYLVDPVCKLGDDGYGGVGQDWRGLLSLQVDLNEQLQNNDGICDNYICIV